MAHVIDAILRLKDQFSGVLQRADTQMAHFARTAQYQGRNMKKVGRVLENTGKSMMTHITLPTALAGGAMAKMAIDTESSFNGIRKTVDATEQQFKQLEKNFDNMSLEIPVDITQLHKYGELAGQLDVKAKDITKFSKTIAELNLTTNLLGEEGAMQLAKFSNIMGMNMNNIDRLGSSIVHLGNNTKTTEADIVNMAMRLAGAGKQINLSSAQVMGISATLSSLGIEAEAGGTAFSRVMLKINDTVMSNSKFLDYYAKVCGTTKDKFKAIWKKDSIKGLEMFSDGLNRFKKQGGNLSMLLDTIGYKDVRVKDTLLRLSTTQGQLTRNVGLGTKAWAENNALQKEAEVRFKETAGKIQLMKNTLKWLGKTIGNMFLPYIQKATEHTSNFAKQLQQLSPEQHRAIVKFALMASGISVAVFVIGKLTSKIANTIINISKFIEYVRNLGGVMAFLTSPAMIVVGVLVAIVAITILVIKHWDKLKQTVKKLTDTYKKYAHQIKTTALFITLFFLPAIIKVGVQAVIAGTKLATGFVVHIISAGVQSARTAWAITSKLIVAIFNFTIKCWESVGAILAQTGAWIAQTATVLGHAVAMGVLKVAQIGLAIVTGTLTGAINLLNLAFVATPIGWIVLGIMAIVGVCYTLYKAWTENWGGIQEKTKAVIDKIREWWNNLRSFLAHPIRGTISLIKNGNLSDLENDKNKNKNVKTDGSHAVGAKRIPYNGYLAELHEDERVLTKQETMEYEQRKGRININKLADTIVVREDADIEKIANALFRKINIAQMNMI